MNYKLLTIFFALFTFSIAGSTKLTPNQIKSMKQAKALNKNGLTNQAIEVYYELFNQYPDVNEIFSELKILLKKQNNHDALNDIASKYIIANNNLLKSKVEAFDIYIFTNNQNASNDILDEVLLNENFNKNFANKILGELLSNNMLTDVLKYIEEIRQTDKSFFSLELAMHYSITMSIEKSLDEFFLHLKYYPKKRAFIFNRILAFPDIASIDNNIKKYLNSSKNINAKLLLSKIEFKQKNYIISYELLLEYSSNEQNLVDFINDLINIKELEVAQTVINDIFNSSSDKKIIEKAIFYLAQIFEIQIVNNLGNNLLINNILESELTNSPFIKINPNKTKLLDKAISIYDSLSIYTNHSKSLFQLAEIKYKILGDLDGAKYLYEKIKNNKNSQFYIDAIESLINIEISRGDLESALNFINKMRINKDKKLGFILSVKELQIQYYQGNNNLINENFNYFISTDNKKHTYYNDILKIKKDLLLFPENILPDYSLAMHKLFQNKRTEAISILEQLIININDQSLIDKIRLDIAYLYFLHEDVNQSINYLNMIVLESDYKEIALLFEAEIYDYLLNDKSKAVDLYLLFLESFSSSIHYESIRIRLRELAS